MKNKTLCIELHTVYRIKLCIELHTVCKIAQQFLLRSMWKNYPHNSNNLQLCRYWRWWLSSGMNVIRCAFSVIQTYTMIDMLVSSHSVTADLAKVSAGSFWRHQSCKQRWRRWRSLARGSSCLWIWKVIKFRSKCVQKSDFVENKKLATWKRSQFHRSSQGNWDGCCGY